MAKKKLSDKRKLRDFFQQELAETRTATPTCRHFGECGGCEFQDVPYERQLEAKQRAFTFILDEVAADWRAKAEAANDPEETSALLNKIQSLKTLFSEATPKVIASPSPLGYRQRMDYVFAFGKAGLRRANRHRQVVELEECPLLGHAGFAVFQKARSLAEAAGVESYDYMRHTGELRYFVVRRSRKGDTLLSLVTKTRNAGEQVMDILKQLVADGDIASGYWLLADGLGDVSFGTPLAFAGADCIREEIDGKTLRIGPNTFFQSNPAVAEKAYAAIRDFVPPGGKVLDMYSGVGSIAVGVARAASEVTAVENVPENVLQAEANIRENKLDNVRPHRDDSTRYLCELAETQEVARPDMVVANPPRPGVLAPGMAAIARLAPARLAYLSCNPFTLLRDLVDIADAYRLRSITLYDMFPQTRHFESLALLEKKT